MRQRLPPVGARLLRLLAGEARAAEAGTAGRTAGAQYGRAFSCLAAVRPALRQPCSSAASLGGHVPRSALLSLSAARQYAAAAADLPAHQELSMPSLSPTMNQVGLQALVPHGSIVSWKEQEGLRKQAPTPSATASPPTHTPPHPTMPPLVQGNIVSWKKKEGDSIAPGDILCEVETDKVRYGAGQATGVWAWVRQGGVAARHWHARLVHSSRLCQARITSARSHLPSLPAFTKSPPLARRHLYYQATIDWEAQEEGFLAKILLPDGSQNIVVGTPVALIVEEASEVAPFADYTPAAPAPKKGGAKKGKKKEEAAAAAAAAAAPASFPPHLVLDMPSLSPTMNQVGLWVAGWTGWGAGGALGRMHPPVATVLAGRQALTHHPRLTFSLQVLSSSTLICPGRATFWGGARRWEMRWLRATSLLRWRQTRCEVAGWGGVGGIAGRQQPCTRAGSSLPVAASVCRHPRSRALLALTPSHTPHPSGHH